MALKTVAIIGGGIGGLASAVLFAKKGYLVKIYDKAQSPSAVGAGFLLQPPGQAVLQKLGILDDVLKHAVPIFGLQSQTRSGRRILDLDYRRLGGISKNGLGVQRSSIYQALLNAASRQENVSFVWSGEVKQCQNINERVSVVTDENTIDYDLCILSSGSNSLLADKHFQNRVRKPYGWGCVWTTFALPKSLSPNILHQRCQRTNKMMGILPVRKLGGQYEAALYWSMKSSDLERFNSEAFPALKQEIASFWPDASASLEPLAFTDFIAANYCDIWTPKPVANRIIALGDISHATSPQLGQGCTMALLDAWLLAEHISQDQNRLEESLKSWWKARKYQLAYVRYLSKFLTPLFQSESKACELFRDFVMAPVGRLPVFDAIQLKTLASEILLPRKKSALPPSFKIG